MTKKTKKTKKTQKSTTKDYVVLGLVLLLVVISGAQAYQLQTLTQSIGEEPRVASTSSSSGDDSRVQAGANLRELPQMVGGC